MIVYKDSDFDYGDRTAMPEDHLDRSNGSSSAAITTQVDAVVPTELRCTTADGIADVPILWPP